MISNSATLSCVEKILNFIANVAFPHLTVFFVDLLYFRFSSSNYVFMPYSVGDELSKNRTAASFNE